tara:strand:- start:679 stop:2925 length:2247 start_codon:yes stop_codon:yes gene_type:complete
MKPTTSTQTVESQGVQDSVSFGIKQSGFAHIFNVLRNQLYSDKVLAVVREYSCNAVDAHVAAGKPETPIKVTLPNRLNPNLSIRDYGDALSDQDIKNIYAFYGESTKRNTNDQIGMLGIGSKAAFAYGDNFVINSFIDGKKHTYNAFIDPSQVGQISKLDVSATDEPDGIEIVVPVRDDDYDEFISRAKDLFEYFPVKPQICGASEFIYETEELLFEGEGWKWYTRDNRYGDPVAVMGNIAYPVDRHSLNLKDDDHRLYNLLKPNLTMLFNIGDLEISASREKLQFTDKTRKAIVQRLKLVESQVIDKALEQFGDCDTMFAAKCLYGSLMDWTSGLYDFREILSKKLTWNGKKIESDHYRFESEDIDVYGHNNHSGKKAARADLVLYKKPDRGFKYRSEKVNIINCAKNVVVIENDLGSKNGMIGRILPLAIDQKKKVYMFTFTDNAAKTLLLKNNNLDVEMVLASTLEKKKVSDYYSTSSSGRNNSSAHSSKHSTTVFEADWDVIKEESKGSSWYRNKTKSAYFKNAELDLDNDKGVYVIIDRFMIQKEGEREFEPWELQRVKTDLELLKINIPQNLYAVKTKLASKVQSNPKMINLWDWVADKIEKVIKDKNLAQKIVDRNAARNVLKNGWSTLAVLQNVQACVVNKEGDFYKFVDAATKMNDEKGSKFYQGVHSTLVALVGSAKTDEILSVKPSHNIMKMKSDIEEKYSMLTIADSWEIRNSSGRSNNVQKILSNYINVVDVASI